MSEKLYTDEELCWATQVAYCNVEEFDFEEYYEDNPDAPPPTLQEIFSALGTEIYYNQDLFIAENTGDKIIMEEDARQFIEDVAAGKICQGWRLVSYKEEQLTNGFYGVTIETGEDNAIVAFRGSESVDIHHKIEDWLVADCGIINGA